MNRYKVFDPVTSNSIQLMINQNFNLYQIVNCLKKERNLSVASDTVKSYIQRKFHKEWNKEKKKWVDYKLVPKLPHHYIDGQLEFNFENR